MLVKDLLDSKGSEVHSITPGATVYDALKLMAEKEIGALVVLDGEKMVGILSERDYARKVILSGKNSQETLVREIMASDVTYTSPDQKVKKCLSIMTKKHFRHMPVLEEGNVVGIISIGDVKSKL